MHLTRFALRTFAFPSVPLEIVTASAFTGHVAEMRAI